MYLLESRVEEVVDVRRRLRNSLGTLLGILSALSIRTSVHAIRPELIQYVAFHPPST